MPPPRPKTAAPLLPKQLLVIQALGKQNEFIYGAAAQFKMKVPLAKKELEAIAKTNPKDQRVAAMVKLAGGLMNDSPKLQSATLAFSKCVKNVQIGKMTYVAFKGEANKIERLCGGLLAYADKYHENHKASDFVYRKPMIKLVDGFCETFGKQVDDLLKLIDKL
jgi:hypothetical protein